MIEAQHKISLDASYRHCAMVARRSASNFWYAFFLLPREKRRAMFALYAFLRHTDDLGDNQDSVESRRAAIGQWRELLTAAASGDLDNKLAPILPALIDTAGRFQIPLELLTAAIDGVESDLDRQRFETFDELRHYCYQVASTVGLACVRIWGYTSDAALAPAKACGVAFQLTNILRDLEEDARSGRVYLPADDMRRFDYSADDLLAGFTDDRFARLMEFEIERAEAAYAEAAELLNYLTHDGRRVFAAMLATYRGLLSQIREQGPAGFGHRVRLSRWQKLRIATHSIVAPRHLIAANTTTSENLRHDLTEAGS